MKEKSKEKKENIKKTEEKNKIKKDNNKKEKKQSNTKDKKKSRKLSGSVLKISLYLLVILLVSLISFVGVYKQDLNEMKNVLPEYIKGTDLYGYRNIVLKVDDSTETKTYDADGNEIEESTTTSDEETEEQTETTTKEVPVNDESVLTADNYKKTKQVIIDRLNFLKLNYYEIKCDESDGTIYIELPENDNTDTLAQYCTTKGDFKIYYSDDEDNVILTNEDIKKTTVQYGTSSSGTTFYLTINFNKQGKKKIKEIVKAGEELVVEEETTEETTEETIEENDSEEETEEQTNESEEEVVEETEEDNDDEDEEESVKSREITLSMDGSTIVSGEFDELIREGKIQLQLGPGTDSDTLKQYNQILTNLAVLLNGEALPIQYTLEVNRFVHSSITTKMLMTIIAVAAIVYVIMLIYMIIRFKKQGILSALTCVAIIASLLIIVRYANVNISFAGIFTIILSAIIEYLALTRIIKVKIKELNDEEKQKELKATILKEAEKLVPLIIIAIIFTLSKWESIYSIGMNLFWAMIVAIVYDTILIKFILKDDKK